MATFRASGNHGVATEFIAESGRRFPVELVALMGDIDDATTGDTRRTLATMAQKSNVRPE